MVQTLDTITNLVDLSRWRAQSHPNKLVYTFLTDGEAEEVHLSYAELDQKARAIGALLQQHVASGERALLMFPPGLDFVTAFFGCLYGGIIAVPAYPPHPNRIERSLPRIQAIVQDADAQVVLTTSGTLDVIRKSFDHVPQLADLLWLTTDVDLLQHADAWRAPNLDSDPVAFLQYTSGSTSTPKGVMVSHGNIIANSHVITQAFQSDERSTYVSWLPLYHDMGLIGTTLQPFFLGSHATMMSPAAFLQRPIRWLQAISRTRAHVSGGPNFAYELCAQKVTAEQRAALDLSEWRIAFNGAEPVRATTIKRFADTFAPCGFRPNAFYPCYGLAESSLFVTGGISLEPVVLQDVQASALERNQVVPLPSEDINGRTLVSSGQVWPGHEVAIVDPESCTACPPDRVGEIWVSGPSVAQGYWNRPEETGRSFRAFLSDSGAGPFLRTGDLGFLSDGKLFVTGRMKDVIIINGHNHYPQDIELTVEQSHSAVRKTCCAAFSVDINGAEQLVIVAEIDRQYRSTEEGAEVMRAIRQAVSRNHDLQTHAIVLLRTGSISKTSSGKIQRHACRAAFLAESLEVWGQERAVGATVTAAVRQRVEGNELSAQLDGAHRTT